MGGIMILPAKNGHKPTLLTSILSQNQLVFYKQWKNACVAGYKTPLSTQKCSVRLRIGTHHRGNHGSCFDCCPAPSLWSFHVISQTRTSGAWLRRFELFGASYAELCAEAQRIRVRVLRKPELSPRNFDPTFNEK